MKNFIRHHLILSSFLFIICLTLPSLSLGIEIRVSVAASMTDAVREFAAAFNRQDSGTIIVFNFGSSGSLAKQINQGAPADMYISANSKWMDYLVSRQKIEPQSVQLFAVNSLVFIGSPRKKIRSITDIPALSRIAIGSPQSVPAGQYAEQAMRAAGIYRQMLTERKLVMAKDVRQALLYADRGEVDGAFVYRTDALLAEHAQTLFAVPSNLYNRIDYPVGLTPDGRKNKSAISFYRFLTGPEAEPILRKFGFALPAETDAGIP